MLSLNEFLVKKHTKAEEDKYLVISYGKDYDKIFKEFKGCRITPDSNPESFVVNKTDADYIINKLADTTNTVVYEFPKTMTQDEFIDDYCNDKINIYSLEIYDAVL